MIGIVVAAGAGYGTYLLLTAWWFGWRGLQPGPRAVRRRSDRVEALLREAGLRDAAPLGLAGTVLGAASAAAAIATVTIGGWLVSAIAAVGGGATPIAAARWRRTTRRELAQEAWPALLDEIRLLTGSQGRPVPNALFQAFTHAPAELRPAFEEAQRTWLLGTDFADAVSVLKRHLADPTADAALETLLVAHEVGGSSLPRRLEALIDDRRAEVHHRRDARAKLAGVRVARRFVLLVPLGLAAVGLRLGDGAASYRTATGQLLVALGIALVAVCWWWAGRLLQLPLTRRVLDR